MAPNRVLAAAVRRRGLVPRTVAIASLALLAASCGSSSPASSSTQSPRDGAAAAFRYAACMRVHGVPSFPDPQVSTSPDGTATSIRQVAPQSLVDSPQGKSAIRGALTACRGLLPGPGNVSPAQLAAQQHAREQDLLAFARCLRSHGVPHFPDPTPDGRLTLEMISAAGVDLHAPAVLPAAKACIGTAHGVITPADVERAVNGGQ
ncbi:MAG: hypothetical protein ACLP01_19180 [Solirubrobacteraceae bacterium]